MALADIFTTLQGFYGSIQVNDFTTYGKNYKVVVQAEDALSSKCRTALICWLFVIVRALWFQYLTILRRKQTGTPSSITRFDNAMAVQIGGSQANGYSLW